MAADRAHLIAEQRRRSSHQRDKGICIPLQSVILAFNLNRPRGITKEQPRRSRRLRDKASQHLPNGGLVRERRTQQDAQYPRREEAISAPLNSRKRHPEEPLTAIRASRKRFRPYPEYTAESKGGSGSNIIHWVMEKTWPRDVFELGFFRLDNIHQLARKKSTTLRRKRSESNGTSSGSNDPKPRDAKPTVYAHRSYPTWLKTQGVYMERSELGISDESKRLCKRLLDTKCDIPTDSNFRNDIFEEVIDDLHDKNESRIIQDIARLLVPSVKTVARVYQLKHLNVLVESVNEGWENSIPLIDPHPQPDYTVGIGRSGLGESRIRKLQLLIGENPSYQSALMATHYMYFPILTSEVQCGTRGLEIADRQNAHSMGLAVRAIVSIFQLAKIESELHQKLATFSVSHDHQSVRLHGWYVVIDGNKFTIHRHLIHAFDITAREGHEKWTAYKFSRGVYDHAIVLLERINAIIDELPFDLNLANHQLGPQVPEHSGPSQQLDEHQALPEEPADIQQVTLEASMEETLTSTKKKKRKG